MKRIPVEWLALLYWPISTRSSLECKWSWDDSRATLCPASLAVVGLPFLEGVKGKVAMSLGQLHAWQ